jgi:hypothetical protein
MLKYEYLVEEIPVFDVVLTDALNDLGKKGWALVSKDRRGSHYECVFVRPLKDGR